LKMQALGAQLNMYKYTSVMHIYANKSVEN
jgi:hypothetical protein